MNSQNMTIRRFLPFSRKDGAAWRTAADNTNRPPNRSPTSKSQRAARRRRAAKLRQSDDRGSPPKRPDGFAHAIVGLFAFPANSVLRVPFFLLLWEDDRLSRFVSTIVEGTESGRTNRIAG